METELKNIQQQEKHHDAFESKEHFDSTQSQKTLFSMFPVAKRNMKAENELTFKNQHLKFNSRLYQLWQKRCIRWASWTRVKSSGIDKINKNGPVLITPNHISWKDIFLVAGMIPRTVHFVANTALFEVNACRNMLDNYFGKLVRYPIFQKSVSLCDRFLSKYMVNRVPYCGAIPAKLATKDFSLFDAIKNTFDQQKLICIFPEGGTGRSSELRRFRLGISRILYRYYLENRISVPVYPVGITGTRRYFHPYMQVGFYVGSPLFIHDYLQSDDFQTYLSFTDALRNAVAGLIEQK